MAKPVAQPASGIENLVSTGAQKQKSPADAFYDIMAKLRPQIAGYGVIRTFKANQEMFFDEVGGLYILKYGTLCKLVMSPNGKTAMAGIFREGDIMAGHLVMPYKTGASDNGIEKRTSDDSKPLFMYTALEKASVEYLSPDMLDEIEDYTKKHHPDLLFELPILFARTYCSQLRQVHELIDLHVFEKSPNRVLSIMRMLANVDDNGALVTPNLTHEQYARLIGMVRESVTLAIGRSAKAEKIRGNGDGRAKSYEIKATK